MLAVCSSSEAKHIYQMLTYVWHVDCMAIYACVYAGMYILGFGSESNCIELLLLLQPLFVSGGG
jgi:hypothetical protein